MHINTLTHNQELEVHRHLNEFTTKHPGRENVRRLEDSFKLKGPHGEHDVFVMAPLGMSLRTLQEMQKDSVFEEDLVTGALDQVLLGLNFLHEADVVHTGTHIGPPQIAPVAGSTHFRLTTTHKTSIRITCSLP